MPKSSGVVDLARAHHQLVFELRFIKARGQAFQDLFSDVMERRYPNDFVRVTPWGRAGDEKNDGYLTSDRSLCQCYGAFPMNKSATLSKIDEDFGGALANWAGKFDLWAFVFNDRANNGTPAWLLKKRMSLQEGHSDLVIELWGYTKLRAIVFDELSATDRAHLLGNPLTLGQVSGVTYDAILPVLEAIARTPVPDPTGEIAPVPADKVKANGLSESVQALLLAGMSGAPRVERFFREWHDPTFGDEVAAAFRRRYGQLRAQDLPPDHIFAELQYFAGAGDFLNVDKQAAALAVVAYLFFSCDIFEAPSGDRQE